MAATGGCLPMLHSWLIRRSLKKRMKCFMPHDIIFAVFVEVSEAVFVEVSEDDQRIQCGNRKG
jgi:hypothetical protein